VANSYPLIFGVDRSDESLVCGVCSQSVNFTPNLRQIVHPTFLNTFPTHPHPTHFPFFVLSGRGAWQKPTDFHVIIRWFVAFERESSFWVLDSAADLGFINIHPYLSCGRFTFCLLMKLLFTQMPSIRFVCKW